MSRPADELRYPGFTVNTNATVPFVLISHLFWKHRHYQVERQLPRCNVHILVVPNAWQPAMHRVGETVASNRTLLSVTYEIYTRNLICWRERG